MGNFAQPFSRVSPRQRRRADSPGLAAGAIPAAAACADPAAHAADSDSLPVPGCGALGGRVNGLIRAYGEQESESRVAGDRAGIRLAGEPAQGSEGPRRAGPAAAGGLSRASTASSAAPETLANGQPGERQHTSALLEIDELGRQLVAATSDRILREAEYRAASNGRSGAGDCLRSAPASRRRQLCHRIACSSFTPGTANWSRNRRS